ncbi:hypothetical protein AB0M29_13665 [Streptomyces sp. NPDC051976]|uniref:hypothetical protein n=1 Tax=Streptomyces sp. NPDC051976 TaxID=3154947 RepID=UPI00343B0C58
MQHNIRPTSVAAYLRCYPHDVWKMPSHHWLLNDLADRRGLPHPAVFFDNGASSLSPRRCLQALLEQARAGHYDVVLIPGPWVFSLEDAEADRIIAVLGTYGCRVIEATAGADDGQGAEGSGQPPRSHCLLV